jgi:hypothetical protein
MNIPNASGAICVCNRCGVAMELHPVENCEFEYAVVKNERGAAIGFFRLGKKEPPKWPTNETPEKPALKKSPTKTS